MKTRTQSILLERATPYPWKRDQRGNLVGANGHAIYFMGEDAVLVEHAPVVFQALLSILDAATSARRRTATLRIIGRIARTTIRTVEMANEPQVGVAPVSEPRTP